ncbi:hypothetical protein [Acanthopleuribacter pedis]|uniref:Uncharacterized protein n=1 Tax=Acanthopleuribacter pedis TaxID=442870 RepID=A0A8J7QFD1_9BACT|nr:hypothetical protein [Acanthopleuribacter pedis]MBO1317395.1 hypothetical protein [Acanthopleuribacter pedis]
MPASERRRTIIIDGRNHNGAWDARALIGQDDFPAFGSWGAFGNVSGSTLAMGKIIYHAGGAEAQRQLFLEAAAHHVFANGYAEAQRGTLKTRIENRGVAFDHLGGYHTVGEAEVVFQEVNGFVHSRMAQVFNLGGDSFRFSAQLWRTFESEVHLSGARIFGAGVFREGWGDTFNPIASGGSVFDLQALISEFP